MLNEDVSCPIKHILSTSRIEMIGDREKIGEYFFKKKIIYKGEEKEK